MNVEEQLRGAMHATSDHLHPDETASFALVRRRGLAARRRRTAQLAGLLGAVAVATVSLAATQLGGDGRSVVAPGRPPPTDERVPTTDPVATTAVAPAPVAPTTRVPQPTAPTTSAAPASVPAPTTANAGPVGSPAPTAAGAGAVSLPVPTSDVVSPTSAAPTTTPPPPTPSAPIGDVLWPGPQHEQFLDAVSAARSFVDEFVGMPNAPLGELRLEQPDIGRVDVHGVTESGTPMDAVVSTIAVRLHGGRWYVTGASATDVQIDTPYSGAEVSSPLRVEGRGRGYEGTIVVEVRQAFQPAGQQLGQDVTVAGCCDELVPFNALVTLSPPAAQSGAIIASTDTGAEHGVTDFTVIPVRFGPVSGDTADVTTLRVFFADASGGAAEVARAVAKTTGVLRASLVAMLDGPTADERAAGLRSWFPDNSGGAVEGVTLADGRATVRLSFQLADLPAAPPPDEVLAQLNATVFQFENVQLVRYELGGSCEAFDRWLARGCEFTRD